MEITVYNQYYRTRTRERQLELDDCLRRNLNHPGISRMVLSARAMHHRCQRARRPWRWLPATSGSPSRTGFTATPKALSISIPADNSYKLIKH